MSFFTGLRNKFISTVEQGDYSIAIKTVGILLAINGLSSFLCDHCLLWISFVVVFTLPKALSSKNINLSDITSKAEDLITKQLNKVTSKIPKFSDLKED